MRYGIDFLRGRRADVTIYRGKTSESAYASMTPDQRHMDDIRVSLIEERAKINSLRKESRKDREVREIWDDLMLANQIKERWDSIQNSRAAL